LPDFPPPNVKVVDYPAARFINFPPTRRVDFPPATLGWAEQTVFPSDDSYVVSGDPNGNYDWDAALFVGYDPDVKTGYTLLKFDVSGLPLAGVGYQLRLLCAGVYGSGTLGLYSVTNDVWLETTVTWNNQPAHVSLLNSRAYVALGAWISFQSALLDAFIQDQIAGDGIASFKLIRTAGSGYQFYWTRENAEINKRPRLYLPAT